MFLTSTIRYCGMQQHFLCDTKNRGKWMSDNYNVGTFIFVSINGTGMLKMSSYLCCI